MSVRSTERAAKVKGTPTAGNVAVFGSSPGEILDGGAIGGASAPTGATYVTLSTDATLSNERVLTAGKNISVTDAGAGSTVTVAADISPTNDGNSGTTKTIDFNSKFRDTHFLTLTGNVTLTLSNPVDGGCYLILIKTGAGGFTVSWPASVLWPSSLTPTITATASKVDLITLAYDATAGKYYGSYNQAY